LASFRYANYMTIHDQRIMDMGSIIDALGGTGEVAKALARSDSTVSCWRGRGLPGSHWAGLAEMAVARGKSDITLAVFADLAARRAEARA
jgi:hypothetical protein